MIPKPHDIEMPSRRGIPKRGMTAYHTPDPERAKARKARHEAKRGPRSRTIPVAERRVIAWDGEGVKLSGDRKPQHYVLFGCSADPHDPLVITTPKDDLDFFRLADYVATIGAKFPRAIHVGYFFKYDHNMIIKSLPWPMKAALYEKNTARARRGNIVYRIRWIPGKSITLSRENVTTKAKPVRVTIDDIGPFFARSFVRAYEATFPVEERGPVWPVVVEGKLMRADTAWEDMDAITRYWQAEIVALERLAVWFRDLMCEAGFPLTKWYGPGALANLLRRRHGLAVHEWGGKVQNMPPEVHDASKRAYFGGHVEQYQAGRVTGPVYVLDINSAYPAAFASLPSLAPGGEWRYREATLRDLVKSEHPRTLSVWQARWTMGAGRSLAPMAPQPLPHRDAHREITYPPMCHGWYWQPELEAAMRAMLVHKRGTLEVFGGWEWHPANDERPWAFMEDMYEERLALKDAGNPAEMAYKLGLNSMYGKMAQRAGWDTKEFTPPRSHTLPLAGYVTAYCRGQIMSMVQRIMDLDPDGVIAVETDGIFTTVNPEHMGVTESKTLGQWSVDIYDELMYVQNGVYMLRRGERWEKVKTRGMSAASVSPQAITDYLATLRAGEAWEPLTLAPSETFVGLGSAIARATTSKGSIAWPKASALHCRWERMSKNVVPGIRGKRIHIPDACPACLDGVSAHARAHPLRVRSTAINGALSAPYALPWEKGYVQTEYEALDERTTWEERMENT